MSAGMKTIPYSKIKNVWPQIGRHILATYDDSTVVVYQAFCPEIAKYACEHGRFGGPKYSFERMTWIKTNFLWMMYRAGWATKKNQERILAITLKRSGFDEILRSASEPKKDVDREKARESNCADDVRLQWDPDHDPSGGKLVRRAVQLGLRRDILKKFHDELVVKITDITDFVHEQHKHVQDKDWDNLLVPEEEVYIPGDKEICRHIRLDVGSESQEGTVPAVKSVCVEGATGGTAMDIPKTLHKSDSQEQTDAIICLGGAFNPVHSRHKEVLTEVKAWLEDHAGYRVIAGLLAVAPDGYVRGKSKGQKFIKGEHRIVMCKLACEHIEWLQPFEKPIGSAYESWLKYTRMRPSSAGSRCIVIVGADRAINKNGNAKWHVDSKLVTTVCIGRKGETKHVQKKYEQDLRDGRVKNKSFFIIPKELDNVSSTQVRKKLEDIKSDDSPERQSDVVMETVSRGWIPKSVGQYIVDHYSDLYFS